MLLTLIAVCVLTPPPAAQVQKVYAFWMKTTGHQSEKQIDRYLTTKEGWEMFARTDGVIAFRHAPESGNLDDIISIFSEDDVKQLKRKAPYKWVKSAVSVQVTGNPAYLSKILARLREHGKGRQLTEREAQTFWEPR